MQWVALDFETFFSDDYKMGQNKLTTEHYVRDKRFDPIMVSIKAQGRASTAWVPKPDIKYVLDGLELDKKVVIAHHAHFDGLILEHYYDVHPARYMCTLSMGRGMLGNGIKLGLASLATHYGLEPKNVPYDLFKGKHYEELTPGELQQIGEGACHDTNLALQVLQYIMAGYISPQVQSMPCFPADELALIDQTVRMFTRPRIIGDTQMFADLWMREQQATDNLLIELGLLQAGQQHDPVARERAAKTLRSDDQFAKLLEAEGIECGEKITPKGNVKYAFAKSDTFMQDLLEAEPDPDIDEWTPGQDRVSLLVQARLKAKSNLEQTRAERLGWMSTRGAMCVYIQYCGAHTTRDSGGDKVNWQNEKRGSPLRKAKLAPKGYLVGTADASQIECRMLNTIVGEERVVQAFRDKRDIYSELASQFYGRTITKEDKPERGTGKQLELSCGYGAGEWTIVATARKGTYGPPVKLTLEEGLRAKNLYRETHPFVTTGWTDGGVLLRMMDRFENYDFYPPFEIKCDRATGLRRIIAPNGMHLVYDSLEYYQNEEGEKYWRIKTRRGYAKLYGSKVIENCIQFISRVHTMQVAVRVERETGLWPWLRNHDELAYLVPDNQYAEPTMKWIAQQMSIAPSWLPQIPLDAEYTLGPRYEK